MLKERKKIMPSAPAVCEVSDRSSCPGRQLGSMLNIACGVQSHTVTLFFPSVLKVLWVLVQTWTRQHGKKIWQEISQFLTNLWWLFYFLFLQVLQVWVLLAILVGQVAFLIFLGNSKVKYDPVGVVVLLLRTLTISMNSKQQSIAYFLVHL